MASVNSSSIEVILMEKTASFHAGIPGDGRCLFRSVAHGACLRSGKPPPDENLQRQLADELRASVCLPSFFYDVFLTNLQLPVYWLKPEMITLDNFLTLCRLIKTENLK